jgi:hypothetical protein
MNIPQAAQISLRRQQSIAGLTSVPIMLNCGNEVVTELFQVMYFVYPWDRLFDGAMNVCNAHGLPGKEPARERL